MAFLLHRDGILWIEFQDGIELWKSMPFSRFYMTMKRIDEDPEDDIVTRFVGG